MWISLNILIVITNPTPINNKNWIFAHPREALIFSDVEGIWPKLSKTYNTDFSELVFSDLPAEKDIVTTLKKVAERMLKIDWEIMPINSNL